MPCYYESNMAIYCIRVPFNQPIAMTVVFTNLRNLVIQHLQMDLPPRTLSSSTASFARDNIALNLASQELDFGTKWTQRLLRTPSPQGLSQPPPLFHGSKNRAMRTSPIPFKGFSDSDSDSDANETDNTGTPNIPSTPLVRTTRASGPIKNFYVLINTFPPISTTTLPSVPKPPHTPPPQTQSIHQVHVYHHSDPPSHILTSPIKSPILLTYI